jgi:NAD-dependent deacetylase
MKKKIVVLTGAGISAESGLQTFRGGDGLWEGHRIEDVATPEAWAANPALVQEFYNMRRKSVLEAKPNIAHKALMQLEEKYDVTHLHGIITRSQSSVDPELIYPINGWELKMGDTCELGSQLRAHVVWFGEAVPMIEPAIRICAAADIFILIGSSLAVYPAAGLINAVPRDVVKYIVDPNIPDIKVSGLNKI